MRTNSELMRSVEALEARKMGNKGAGVALYGMAASAPLHLLQYTCEGVRLGPSCSPFPEPETLVQEP